MSYGLIYTVPFASLDNEDCVVEIEKEGYSGEVIELTGGSSPFTVDIEGEEFLYTPTRFSTATIRIVGNDYLQSLFAIAYQQYRVTFKRNGVVTWCGFIKPELYTQDYTSETFELELECMSAMSSLEFIDYSQAGENRVFVSLWDLLKKCISSAKGQYIEIYIPHVYGPDEIEYNSNNNILEEMTISEQNFFDEDDKPMKLKEVLEEICKFLNWTCVDWKGELYFVDNDHLGEFRRHDPVSYDWEGSTASPESNNIQRIGFAGSDNSLDILPGFNKATVKCSNYPVGDVIPEAEFGVKEMYDSHKSTDYGYTKEIWVQGMILDAWKVIAYGEHFPLGSGDMYELTDEQVKISGAWLNYNMRVGATAYKVGRADAEKNGDGYKVTGANYSWTTLIRYKVASKLVGKPILIIKGALSTYRQCAIGIMADILFTTNYAEPNKVTIQEFHTLRFSLRIGDEYWNGASWQESEATFDVGIGKIGEEVERTSIRGTKTADMPYDGLTGYIIRFPDDRALIGELEIIMYAVDYPYQMDKRIGIVDIENFKLTYKKKDDAIDEGENSDRIYENIINENYINELDEIEFKISSYNNDGACYSKVILGEKHLTDNLYSDIEKTYIRPEEQLIRRIIKRYSAPRIKLTQVIKATPELTPITRLSDNYMVNKKFINAGGTIDYAMNQFTCIMIEV